VQLRHNILLAWVFLFVAIGLLVFWARTEQGWAEPAFVGVLLLVALLTGDQVFKALSDLQERAGPLPLEASEDPTTRPWGRTNHGFAELRWHRVSDWREKRELSEAWHKQRPRWAPRWGARFERLLEDTSSLNFRVRFPIPGRRWQYLLRLHRNASLEEITCRSSLAEWLANEDIFDKNISRWVVPLEPRKGASSPHAKGGGERTVLAPGFDLRGEVYEYAGDDVTHFTGCSKREVQSVGELLGKLQAKLKNLGDETRDLDLTNLINHPRNHLRDDSELDEVWGDIQELWNREELSHPVSGLLKVEKTRGIDIESLIREAKGMRSKDLDPILLLHDVHPHNVFSKQSNEETRCVLIYDYQWLGRWPHGHVLAFALHRFTRELVVNGCQEQQFIEGVSGFLEAYERGSEGSLKLPDEFRNDIPKYIRSSNLDKLLAAVYFGLSGYDPLGRGEARLLLEIKKFIRYIKESDAFGDPPSLSAKQRTWPLQA